MKTVSAKFLFHEIVSLENLVPYGVHIFILSVSSDIHVVDSTFCNNLALQENDFSTYSDNLHHSPSVR